MRRIGIFPGVFDPVHNGHIAFAAAAQKTANLDAVYIIPESNPWHKTNVTPLRHRIAMVRLMTADQPALQPLRLGMIVLLFQPWLMNYIVTLTMPNCIYLSGQMWRYVRCAIGKIATSC